MLRILELGGNNPGRLDALARLLDSLAGDPELEARWIVVQPDRGTWTEARGRQLLIEHVEAPRWALRTPEQALVSTVRLLELTQLHRPAAIICHSPVLLPIVARIAARVLEPRPAVICTWVDAGARAWARRGLGRLDARLAEHGARAWGWWTEQGLASFDALFVSTRGAATQLRRRGLERLYYVPRGVDLVRFHPGRAAAGRGASADSPLRGSPVFIDAPAGVDVALLRRVWAKLRASLPREVGAHIHGPDSADFARFVARRRGLERCGAGDVEARAHALARAEVALVLPGFDDGRAPVAEALASGCAVVSAGPGADRVAASGCGRVFELDALSGHALADAVLAWLDDDELATVQARARLEAEAEAEIGLCLARELACVRDVAERVRTGVGVPEGLRELEPVRLRDAATPLPASRAAAPSEAGEDEQREAGEG